MHKRKTFLVRSLLALLLHGGCAETVQSGADAGSAISGESCGLLRCESGQFCCHVSGRCLSRDQSATCSNRLSDASLPGCLSNFDCASSEFCDGRTCLGVGFCTSRIGAICSGAPSFECGCDGVTYRNACERLAAGARLAVGAACGVPDASSDAAGADASITPIGCSSSVQCPTGSTCCATSGLCQPEGCVDCCLAPLPDGGTPCVRNDQCLSGRRYCAGQGCGTIGVCVSRPPGADCDGTLDPVCGCDGRTYSNRCWASSGGARIAHAGSCP
jgi:Kazal-type serine protease inhibitor domain